ncbi:hypothetical protein [Thermomonospora amylolytica]|uniref:hypothetical protein n=1 Tax=Thermomonospora amylolytica TaxID=1411117 RepID=UPI000E6BC2E4|nr:hypothetical protein [Thermomonospora amylolytica]
MREPDQDRTTALLSRWLHEEATRHQPDRDRIWSRVETAMRPPEPRPARRHRRAWSVTATATATAAIAAVTSLTVADRADVLPSLPLAGRGTTGASAPPSRAAAPGRQQTREPTTAPTRPTPGPKVTVQASLSPSNSRYWAENRLTLHVHRPLKSLQVTIQVARTGTLAPAGAWSSLPASDHRPQTRTTRTAVIYHWTLHAGRTLRPGTYTFAAQYTPGPGHRPAADTYTVTTPTPITGHF